MNDSWMLGVAGSVGGMLGALLGGLLVWRQLKVRLALDVPLQVRGALAPLQSNAVSTVVAPTVVAPAVTPLRIEAVERAPAPATPTGIGLDPLAERLASALDIHFDAQRQAWQDVLQRIPQTLRQALQIELVFLAQQQVQRDAATAQREDERAAALCALIGSLATPALQTGAPTVASLAPAVTSGTVPVPVPSAFASASPTVSARPPELLLTPLPRPEPVYEEPETLPDLSDDELDALPPELPIPDKPRKRILQSPRKPVLRSI